MIFEPHHLPDLNAAGVRRAGIFRGWRAYAGLLLVCAALIPLPASGQSPADLGYSGWFEQTNPPTDPTGFNNTNLPEASSSTYFTAGLRAAIGSTVTIHGRYPFCRFMSLEIYTTNKLASYIDDVDIQPDPGQNNPFVSGTANGTFTAYLVFGEQPTTPAPNTLYTGTLTNVTLMYRMYHATNPNDPAAGATDPVTPDLSFKGKLLSNIPVLPYLPALSTPWLRLDQGDWTGTPPTPAQMIFKVTDPPAWQLVNPLTSGLYPNGDNYQLTVKLSRQFLQPNTSNNLFVFKCLAPTFPNTRAGQPVYTNAQVRYWSACTGDPYTTGTTRCIPDDGMLLDPNGYVTIVVSDPGSEPSPAAMTQFYGNWLAWGALDLPADVVYDRDENPWGIDTPVFYYNSLIIRQTLANPTFTQSFANIALLPPSQQRAAMGGYWPISGYCSTANFEAYGADCVNY